MTTSVIPSVSVITTPTQSGTASGTAQVLPSLSTRTPDTSGTVIISLAATAGKPASAPLLSTSISTPTTTLVPTKSTSPIPPPKQMNAQAENIFQPVDTAPPPGQIGTRGDHPVPRLNIAGQNSPISTNKFYSNFFLGSQTAPAWTHPYSLAWSKGGSNTKSWGMVITHLDDNQKVFGPDPAANPVQYFVNPIGIQAIVISALELGSSTVLTTNSLTAFSANVELHPNASAPSALTFPLVQGMGFVTAGINMVTPIIQSGVFFRSVTKSTQQVKPGVTKYTIKLEDDRTWLLYAISDSGVDVDFKVVDNGLVQATSKFQGIIQISKNPSAAAEALYDTACGVYPMTAAVSGNVDGAVGSYTFSFRKQGLGSMMGAPLLMYALPHHVASFSGFTRNAVTGVQLATTTKGNATAVVADSWTFTESLPTTLGFAPWQPETGKGTTMSSAAIQAILGVATSEISQNMSEQSNLNSMYYSGKALAKFAGIIYTVNDLLSDQALAQEGLKNLKDAFSLFTNNRQKFPLVYETAWKGVVSTASYVTGDPGADFGNSYYNDHHFHYGYFVYAAAIIGYLDSSWLDVNKDWVNSLVRDYANPSSDDPYFPVSRNFDWYHGHSFAHGLYETFDGRDQESSSEDSMSSYALKLWGRVTGNSNLEAVANIQLAVTARSLQSYFLYTSNSNSIQPPNFTPNKVSGILFENKIDHTTYFGTNPEYVQGIHMLPILPHSTLTRTKQFVQEEWDVYFSNGRAEKVSGGWRGILFSNLALIDPSRSWNFFARGDFDASWLDGGASRTWCLAMAAGMGGGP
ncbi:glycoside hydrolase family 81 protein [Halenospora varia]|nr:glycoside hydrolase family 81 protein [Halenospora varia]